MVEHHTLAYFNVLFIAVLGYIAMLYCAVDQSTEQLSISGRHTHLYKKFVFVHTYSPLLEIQEASLKRTPETALCNVSLLSGGLSTVLGVRQMQVKSHSG